MILSEYYKTIGATSVGKEFPWITGFLQPGDTAVIYDLRGQELDVDTNPEYKDYISQYLGTRMYHKLFTDNDRTGIRVTVQDVNAENRVITIMLYNNDI